VGDHEVLHDINMEIRTGETHVLFWKERVRKDLPAHGDHGVFEIPDYKGEHCLQGNRYPPVSLINERAALGIGMSFQRPPTIRGLKTRDLVELLSRDNGGETESHAKSLNFSEFLDREINHGLSGGEIKKSELLQLMAQNPDLILLDEPESGVDLENIALIGKVIKKLLQKNPAPAADKVGIDHHPYGTHPELPGGGQGLPPAGRGHEVPREPPGDVQYHLQSRL